MSDESPTGQEPPKPAKPVIDLDADPHNANWLRILAQRRKDKAEHAKYEAKYEANEDRFPWLNDL
jgi:hypothetical protein